MTDPDDGFHPASDVPEGLPSETAESSFDDEPSGQPASGLAGADQLPGAAQRPGTDQLSGTDQLPGADQLPPLVAATDEVTAATSPDGVATSRSSSRIGTEDLPPLAVRRALPRILAIANQKGGVGKTTTAVNLGAALAELGYRVLVVDLDPQGNATTGLGINARNLDASVYDVILHDVPIEDTIEPTSLRNLFVVPATIDLAGAEIELVPVFSRELRMRRA
ncbi:MAG TPA: AAA family ATPase, partial [Acidimicrobiales bacterium]|nr:AAA family ATPase [Acidimicrobiales bacterium]